MNEQPLPPDDDDEEDTGRRMDDDEIKVMNSLLRALAKLPAKPRQRIMAYLYSRYVEAGE
jgi:hypothetical protein